MAIMPRPSNAKVLCGLVRRQGGFVMALCVASVGGCAAQQVAHPAAQAPPSALIVEPGTYAQAFDVAVEAARMHGMTAALRDRRGGLIETDPSISPSLLVPWDRARVSPGRATEATLSMHRHRARFEFRAQGSEPRVRRGTPNSVPETGHSEADPLAVADHIDLTMHAGAIEMIVVVEVERSHSPGLRRSAWTQYGMRQARIIDPATNQPMPLRLWSTAGRDTAMEQRLRAAIDRELRR
jgi:hypothetical protein